MGLTTLVRDWLTDPIALLFLITLFFLLKGLFMQPSFGAIFRLIGWVGLMLLISAPKVVNPLLAHLEDQHALDPTCSATTIVALGGGVSSAVTTKEELQGMSHATFARTIGAWRLAQHHADVPVVLAGGAHKQVTEAQVMGEFLTSLGLAPERLLLEGSSKSTAQNAVEVAELLRQKDLSTDIWLVTSASHMPRARDAFVSQGLQVCTVPVGHEAVKRLPAYAWMPQTTALVKFDKWLHELIAAALYKAKGFGA